MSATNYLPCGLANLGNTCFLNSCIQILNYTYEIKNAPLNDTTTMTEQQVYQDWCELRNLMLNARGQMTNPVATPGKFIHTVHQVAKIKGRDIFTGWAQNDLPEFLLFMIECMHNSRKRSVNMQINGTSETTTDDLAFECYSMIKENYKRGDYSEFSDLFYGVYVSRLFTPDCSLLHSNKPELFGLLDLPIPPSSHIGALNSQISLKDCFDTFVADELLSGWFNDKTQQTEPVRKNIAFWSFPKILMITLKRYSPDGQHKNNVFIDFPLDNLDLSKYVVGYKANTYKYKLFGVANHMGNVSGGHYTAFVNIQNNNDEKRVNGERESTSHNKWYCFNDATVSEMEKAQVVSSSAYCLFYRKQ